MQTSFILTLYSQSVKTMAMYYITEYRRLRTGVQRFVHHSSFTHIFDENIVHSDVRADLCPSILLEGQSFDTKVAVVSSVRIAEKVLYITSSLGRFLSKEVLEMWINLRFQKPLPNRAKKATKFTYTFLNKSSISIIYYIIVPHC